VRIETAVLGVVVGLFVLLVIAGVVGRLTRIRVGGIHLEFPTVEAEAAAIRAATSREKSPEGEDDGFLLLREYHARVLAQSKVSFWFSMVFAALGFGLIVFAVLVSGNEGQAAVSLIAGVVVNAVSGLFLVQSSRAQRQLVEFFDRLRVDRKLGDALNLAADIRNPIVQSRLQGLLVLGLAEVKLSDEQTTQLFAGSYVPVPLESQQQTTLSDRNEAARLGERASDGLPPAGSAPEAEALLPKTEGAADKRKRTNGSEQDGEG
jgi:hypothetical protein